MAGDDKWIKLYWVYVLSTFSNESSNSFSFKSLAKQSDGIVDAV
jgi:hypothetical protein